MNSRRLLSAFFFLLVPVFLRSADLSEPVLDDSYSKTVLVVCSHSEISDWSMEMLAPVKDFELTANDTRFYYSYLKMTSLDGVEDIEKWKKDIVWVIRERRPDMLVLVGGSAFSIARDMNEIWPDIPMLLAGECDYACEKGYAIGGKADPDAIRTPISELKKEINCTLVETPAFVDETVNLMKTLIPDMHKILYIGGENFQSKEHQITLENTLREKFPEIDYEPLLASEYSTEELIHLMKGMDYSGTGILYSSWIKHAGYLSSINARNNISHILEDMVPMFSMTECPLETHPRLLGYCSSSQDEYAADMKTRMEEILFGGARPSEMPFISYAAPSVYLNWSALVAYGFNTKLIPRGAVVLNKPESVWQAYGKYIIYAVLALLAVFALMVFLLMHKSIRLQTEAKQAAEQSNRMKTVFIQNMSHEVRTPLNAIVGFSQLLGLPAEMLSEEERAEYTGYVLNNANMLTMLVDDILNAADVDSGKYHVSLEDAQVNEICRSAIKSTEYRALPGVNMYYTTEVADDFSVRTDPRRVQQVLINFLTNACKHTEEGEIHVHCSLSETSGRVSLSVADTGCGIPADQAEKIFERFSKLDNFVQGTGLGLNICREIADRLGGKVYLDTSYTGGARFVFEINA